MNLSNETNELFKAFSLFQGELCNASKSKEGHNYKYADLSACIAECKPLLAKNGLAVTQMLGGGVEGQTLTTMMTHSSGQYMSETVALPKAVLSGGGGKNPVQCLGSSITYMRRYAYSSITGLTQEDDDGKGHVAPKKADSADMIEIKNAIKTSDVGYVKANWEGVIAKEWKNLDRNQADTLSKLINQ